MKKKSIFCLLAFVALCGLTACNEDPESINNAPEVFVDEASDLLRTSAVLTGRILAPEKASIKEHGFKVSTSADFYSADTQIIKIEDDEAEFSTQLTNLAIGGTYFYISYATNGLDEMTSTIKAFTTPQRSGVLLTDLQLLDENTATFSARVGDTGGGDIQGVGFCWGEMEKPTIFTGENCFASLADDNTFTASLKDLEAGKTYYVRAFTDSDITGDGTSTISYSRDVLTIRLQQELPKPEPEPIWMLSGSLQGGEDEIYFVEDSQRGMFVAEDVNLTLWCRFKVYQVEYPEVAYGYAEQTRTTHDMVDARLPLDLNGEDIEPTHEGVFDIWFDLDGKYLYIMSDGKTPEEADDYEPDPTGPASNEIWYTSTDGNIVEPYSASGFGVNIVSNTQENGQGVITFDGPVTGIGDKAFGWCSSLTSVTIPDSVTSIGKCAFQQCELLTSITIPDSVTSIGDGAFVFCYSLTNVTIPNSVTSIGEQAFHDCDSLTSVTIPDSVTSIGESAFCCCTSLTAFYGKFASADNRCLIVDGELNAFAIGCGATEYAIPDGITSIGATAFEGCNSLISVTIPNSVTSIGMSAFSDCESLERINIPESITSIGCPAFADCTSLTAFYGKFATEDNLCLIVDGVLNAFAIGCGATEYTIPENVNSIGACAFRQCKSLTSITIPDSVTEIVYSAFSDCESLASINIPNGVTFIPEYAFAYCYSLTNITIPKGVTAIGWYAFYGCTSLQNVYCEPTTPPVGDYQIFDYNASDRKIYVPSASVEAYKSAQFWSDYADAIYPMEEDEPVYNGPADNEIWYTSTDGKIVDPGFNTDEWGISVISNTYENGQGVIVCDGPIKKIDGGFYGKATLKTVQLPNSVTSLEDYICCNCANLEEVYLGNGISTIDNSRYSGYFNDCPNLKAFHGPLASSDGRCVISNGILHAFAPSGLTSYAIPSGVTEIGSYAFMDTASLTDITIPEGVKKIRYYAFNNTGISSIHIPESVEEIEEGAFSFCEGLSSITGRWASSDNRCMVCNGVFIVLAQQGISVYTIPAGVEKIGSQSLCWWYGTLKKVVLPDGLKTIGEMSFYYAAIASIDIPDTVTTIEENAFNSAILRSVTLPANLTSIGGGAFGSCTSLETVYCKSEIPPTAVNYWSGDWKAFDTNATGRKIYVPIQSVEAYKTAEGWSDYADSIYPMDGSGEVTGSGSFGYTGSLVNSYTIGAEAATHVGLGYWYAQSYDPITDQTTILEANLYPQFYEKVTFEVDVDWLTVGYGENETWWYYDVEANTTGYQRTATVTATFYDVEGYVLEAASKTKQITITQDSQTRTAM